MKEDEGSKTAEFVCLARAAAHGKTKAPKFSDPTAETFLSADAREALARLRGDGEPDPRDLLIRMRSEVMVARTVAIDDAIRAVTNPQLVNLGAGLDGRAWRMSELSRTVVFEVDHPATQTAKRARAATLQPTAKEIRFVAVDFVSDSLDAALAAAGHEPLEPTTWLWEGVIPYLAPADVEASLAVVRRRSAPGSRIAIAYQAPPVVPPAVPAAPPPALPSVWKNEPLRSFWTVEQMSALLERAGFHVESDRDLVMLADACGADLSSAGSRVSASRVVVAAL